MVRTDSVRAEEAWKQSGLTFADIQVGLNRVFMACEVHNIINVYLGV